MMTSLVVGSGITGASIARMLAEKTRVTVIDRNDHLAGSCYDYRDENNIMIHRYGSHIFHTNSKPAWDFIRQFALFNIYMHKVVAVIDGIETTIPFNLNTLYDVFPQSLAERLEKKLLSGFEYGTKIPIMEFSKQSDPDMKFLADYVYEKVFLHYTMKQWGKTPQDIDSAVTARIPIYLSRDNRYFQDTYQGIPLCGYTSMIRKMLEHENIAVRFKTDFKSMDSSQFDHIFYTGSIDELFDYKYGVLPYRSLRFEFETHDQEHYLSNAVVNYPCNYDFTRIHEYKYYLNDISCRTVIAKEYPEEFEVGKNDRYYPIENKENIELYNRYLKEAKDKFPNIHFLGRLGDYKYYDMDKSILRAMDVYREVFQ